MVLILNAIVPMIILLALGQALRRFSVVREESWKGIGQLLYYFFFPALLIARISTAQIDYGTVGSMAAAIMLAVLILFALLIVLQFIMRFPPASFTSIVQCCSRLHTFVFLYLAAAAFGDEALALAGIFTGFYVIFANTISVSTLSICLNKSGGLRTVISELVKNPLVLASLIGLTINLTGARLPGFLYITFELLGEPALPVSLLCVGAGLVFRFETSRRWAILVGTLGRMLVVPIFAYGLMRLFEVEGLALALGMLFSASPTASQAYILAQKMGGDHEAMAAMITTTTLFSLISLPLILLIFAPLGG